MTIIQNDGKLLYLLEFALPKTYYEHVGSQHAIY